MALDERGEHFVPTEQQVSDRDPHMLGGGFAPETGRGANFVTEAPVDAFPYARQNGGWVRIEIDINPPPPPPLSQEQILDAVVKRLVVDVTASEIKLDPPVLGKNNLQELLHLLTGTVGRSADVVEAEDVRVVAEPEPEPEPEVEEPEPEPEVRKTPPPITHRRRR